MNMHVFPTAPSPTPTNFISNFSDIYNNYYKIDNVSKKYKIYLCFT